MRHLLEPFGSVDERLLVQQGLDRLSPRDCLRGRKRHQSSPYLTPGAAQRRQARSVTHPKSRRHSQEGKFSLNLFNLKADGIRKRLSLVSTNLSSKQMAFPKGKFSLI